MKPLLCLTIISLCLSFVEPCSGGERILQEWSFGKAPDTLKWSAAEPLSEFGVKGGELAITAGANRPKLESPIFDIVAAPWQRIEIEMKSDADGPGFVYYSNTSEQPYNGFRPPWSFPFTVKGDGQYHTCTLMPFWQGIGRITHIRIDPPGNSVAIRAVRIVDMRADEACAESSWPFANNDRQWRMSGSSDKSKDTSKGLMIAGDSDATLFSPPLDINPDNFQWVTIRMASPKAHTVLFRWAGAGGGLQSVPIEVKGDKTVHSYSIELGQSQGWDSKILMLGITPSDSSDKHAVLLESVTLGELPSGPPELKVTSVGLEQPFVRVGQKAKLYATAVNVGGMAATSVAGIASIQINGKQLRNVVLDTKRIPRIDPGKEARFEWTFTVPDAPAHVTCRVSALDLEGEQKSINIAPQPKLDKKAVAGLKYVPVPQPADTGEYLVGAYYFPGWNTYARWSVLNAFPERKPILGYYREGDPEVADWQINWALSHGISYFIYDWYWSAGARQLEHGLHNGFLNSKYRDKMKFCLLWANHNAAGTSSAQDMLDVTKYWIENYFNKPNYLKIQGKNVMVIFSPGRFTEDMGKEAVKASFDKMRKMCEDAGVGGLYLVANTYPGADGIRLRGEEGYDALSGYNYPAAGNRGQKYAPYEWMVDAYKDIWQQITDAASIPYIPVCEAGWDARPWNSDAFVRTGKTPELWQKMLTNARGYVDDAKHKLPNNRKLIFLEAWNELGEGDYIEPHAEFGFGYLEAVRLVFAPKSKAPTIVVPQDIGMGPYDLPASPARTSWDFSKADERDWSIGNMSSFSYDGGVMSAEAMGDPAFYSPTFKVEAAKFKTLEIRMKMDKGDEGQVFFSRSGTMTEDRSVKFPVNADNEFHTYTLDMSANRFWRGTISQIRIDPCSTVGAKVAVAYVKFR